jgi:hypothetical protein
MQQDFDVGVLPVEAVLLVADVLDRCANHSFDMIVGHGLRVGKRFTRDHDLLVVASVSRRGANVHGSMPAFGPSRKTDRRSRRRSGRRPCPDGVLTPIQRNR